LGLRRRGKVKGLQVEMGNKKRRIGNEKNIDGWGGRISPS